MTFSEIKVPSFFSSRDFWGYMWTEHTEWSFSFYQKLINREVGNDNAMGEEGGQARWMGRWPRALFLTHHPVN